MSNSTRSKPLNFSVAKDSKRETGPAHANDLVKQILGLKGVVISEVSLSQGEIVL